MDRTRCKMLLGAVVCAWTALLAGTAQAGSHTWEVNELFSSADGTIQFIELFESLGASKEVAVPGHTISSDANAFTLVGETLVPPTSNKFLLIATQAFADLPNAPTPDYIIPAGVLPFFFSLTGDSVAYEPWDTVTFGAGELPTDGIRSLNFEGTTGDDGITGVNSPTNYAGETGSVDVSVPPDVPAASSWGLAIMGIMITIAATLIVARPIRGFSTTLKPH